MSMNFGSGGGGLALAGPTYSSSRFASKHQMELEKTTRIYVVVYPSDAQSRTFGPESMTSSNKSPDPGSVMRGLQGDEIEGLGYGIYVEPAKGSGKKKLFQSTPKIDGRLFTFEEGHGGQMEVKVRTGAGIKGMLVRFLVAQHGPAENINEMMQKVHAIMDAAVLHQKDAGVSGIRTVLQWLQEDFTVEKWDIDEFVRVMDMVVESSKKEGTKVFSITTVNYLAHAYDQK